jgi:hypothetical protein
MLPCPFGRGKQLLGPGYGKVIFQEEVSIGAWLSEL